MAPAKVLGKEEWQKQKLKVQATKLFPRRHGSDWKGLLVKPGALNFATQNEDEIVYILLRRHVITNIGWVTGSAIMAALPSLLFSLILALGINVFDIFSTKLITIASLVYYSVILTGVVRNFIDWYFNLYIVTNERVIDYDFKSFVSNGVAEANLLGIEEVREETVGFVPNLFNYGTIRIFTEGNHNPITFHDTPEPTLVRDKVADLAKIAKNLLRD